MTCWTLNGDWGFNPQLTNGLELTNYSSCVQSEWGHVVESSRDIVVNWGITTGRTTSQSGLVCWTQKEGEEEGWGILAIN